MIRAILLDLFGTLVAYGDVEEGTRLAWEGVRSVVHELGATVAYDAFAAEWQAQLNLPLAPVDDVAETPFLGKLLRLFRSYGLPQDRAAAKRAADNCLRGWDSHLYLPDDTIPTLDALRRQYALGLVSNFDHPPFVREVLARYGLADRFQTVVISGDVRIEKPDPRIYLLALEALACPAEGALFVGDTPETDIGGAERVGCPCVLIDMKGRHSGYAGTRIQALGELLSLVPR